MKFLEKYQSSYKPQFGIPNLDVSKAVVPKSVPGDIGLELEIEGQGLPTGGFLERIVGPRSRASWDIHQDGSLRGESAEYVLNTPCYVEEVEGLVFDLYKVFESRRSTLDLSNRCSTHVHVNVGGLKINELTSVLALWSTFEEALINWCGEERKTNHFCLGGKDSSQVIDSWHGALQGGGFNFQDGMKYAALNIRTLRTIGSFEFRCMRADQNPLPIVDWAKTILSLRNYSQKNFQNPQDIASRLSEYGGTQLLGQILQEGGCSPDFLDQILSVEENHDFDRMALRGLRRAQLIVGGLPWHLLLPEIQKVSILDPFMDQPKMKSSQMVPDWEPVAGDHPFSGDRGQVPRREVRLTPDIGRTTAAPRFHQPARNLVPEGWLDFTNIAAGVEAGPQPEFDEAVEADPDIADDQNLRGRGEAINMYIRRVTRSYVTGRISRRNYDELMDIEGISTERRISAINLALTQEMARGDLTT